MPQDLRTFLDQVKRDNPQDFLVISREVDPTFEITAITVKLEQKTNYPSSGDIDLTVTPSRPESFVLKLRIPRWAESATVAIN